MKKSSNEVLTFLILLYIYILTLNYALFKRKYITKNLHKLLSFKDDKIDKLSLF